MHPICRTESDKWGVFLFFRVPEQIVQGQPQDPADADAQPDGGVIVALFDGVDGLAGYAHHLGQGFLAQVHGGPGGF